MHAITCGVSPPPSLQAVACTIGEADMIELVLRYHGDGKYVVVSPHFARVSNEEFDAGERLVGRFFRMRSASENRLFHGVCELAWMNQCGGPVYSEEEGGWRRLKAWLLCEAGHCTLHEFAPEAVSEEVVKVLRATHHSCFWSRTASGRIRMRQPRPISFAVLKSSEFQPIKARVFEIICTTIVPGTTPEMIMDMARRQYGVMRSKKGVQHEQ